MRSRPNNNELMPRVKYYFIYTLLFIAIAFLMYLPFIIRGKSFVFCDTHGGGDGLVQHFNSFVYYGDYLREIINTLFTEHKLVIPMFDLTIGYGQDIVQTLSYYVIGDPFSFLSVFFSHENAELGYSLIILLRIYLAGVAFSEYCRYRKSSSVYTMVGAFIYVFSTYTILISILHPYFTNPMVFLPIICIGAERILDNKGSLLFILAIAISGLSNFYFFYMLVIFTVLYVVFRYIETSEEKGFKQFAALFLRFLGAGISGTLLAATLVLPSVLGIISSTRINVESYVPLIYEKDHFIELIAGFFGDMFMGYSDYYVYLGYTVLGFISVVTVFLHIKESKEFKFLAAALITMLIFLVFPFFGHAFNGFSYVTNRWLWVLAFLVAYSITRTMPLWKDLNKRNWIGKCVAVPLMILTTLLHKDRSLPMMGVLLVISSVGIIIVAATCFGRKRRSPVAIPLLVAVVSIVANSWLSFLPIGNDYLNRFTNKGTSYPSLTTRAPGYIINELNDPSIYRYDLPHYNNYNSVRNASMQMGNYSTNYYFSTTNPSINDFVTSNYLNYSLEQSYVNLDNRSMLQSLVATKYVSMIKDDRRYLPFGYGELITKNDGFELYKTDYALPFGFTSDKYISRKVYDSLTPVERQQALFQGIVLDSSSLVENTDIVFNDMKLDISVSDAQGVKLEDGKFIAEEEMGYIEFSFPPVKDGELYVIFENIDFEVEKDDDPYHTVIDLNTGKYKTWLALRNYRNNYYSGKHNFISSLSYSGNERSSAAITFRYKGEYTFDDFGIVFQPMEGFADRVKELSEYHLNDVKLGVNSIKGVIEVPEKRLLCLQVPYSEGWKCKVDDAPVEVKVGDIGFMAIELEKGFHSIEFTYETPYLKISVIISLLTALMLIIWYNARRYVNRRK